MRWFIGLLLVWSSLFADITVVASDGDSLTSKISSQASRCDYYIVIDEQGKVLETIQNSHKDVKGGASSKLVTMLKRKNISRMIAARFGDKLISALESSNIKYTVYEGDIHSAVKYIKTQ